MESGLRRIIRRGLARFPRTYLTALKVLQRGSAEKRLYLSVVRKGDVVIDVGANVGYFTMLFADLAGKKGQVHAFEPVPSTFQQLCWNIRTFPAYANVCLNCSALGDRNQRITMFVPGSDHGQAALVNHREGSWKNAGVSSVEVEMARLDDYSVGLGRIDFVKCDVEGAELLVLRGAESTLRRHRPKLFLEIEDRWMNSFGWAAEDLLHFLRAIGYQHFYMVESRIIPIRGECRSNGTILCSWEEVSGLA
jgi:FkbM family methyltransferase